MQSNFDGETAAYKGRSSANPTSRSTAFTPDDLLTLATTKRLTNIVIKAYLGLLITAAATVAAAGDHVSLGLGSLVDSFYAFDPPFWSRLSAGNDVSAFRDDIAEASRRDVILIPAQVTALTNSGDGRPHSLLLMVLRSERVVECYDSRRDADSGEDRCWRALERARTALVQRELTPLWAKRAAAIAAANTSSRAAYTTSNTAEENDDAGGWEMRIMNCAQQPVHEDCSNGENGFNSVNDNSDDHESALYMLWFARCIMLGDAGALMQPPPPGFVGLVVRELGSLCAC
jgi:hypothetical protein